MGSFINYNETTKLKNNDAEIHFDESLFLMNNSDIKSSTIYDIRKFRPHQINKIKDIIETFHENGIPRKSDDFSYKNFSKFYKENDPYFSYNDIGLIKNHIKIYNEKEKDFYKIQIYKGDLNAKGEREGIGKLQTQYYELVGMWKNDNFSGWGRQSRCNGELFEGRFENGLLNGKGIFLDKKSKYLGEFRDYKKWGKGKLITDKFIYIGDFQNNKMEGKGEIKFLKSGIEFNGNFVNDNIEGYGVFKFANGDIYEGEVKNNKMDGNGMYKYNNGKIYKGLFSKGHILKDGKMINLPINNEVKFVNNEEYKIKSENIPKKELNEQKEIKELNEQKEIKEVNEQKGIKEINEQKEIKEINEQKEKKEIKKKKSILKLKTISQIKIKMNRQI